MVGCGFSASFRGRSVDTMTTLSPSALIAQLSWRYATKKFDPARKISADAWEALEQALILSPSSFGLQPWRFLVITDPAKRAALVPHTWNQTQPLDCLHFVVLTVKTDLDQEHVDKYLDRIVAIRGGSREAMGGFKGMMMNSLDQARTAGFLDQWQTHQVYIALGQFMAAAAVLGIDTCPMEGLVPDQYDRELGLVGTGYHTVVACAAGYRAANDKYAAVPKVRFSASQVVQHI